MIQPSEYQPYKLQLVFNSKTGRSGPVMMQQMVPEFCKRLISGNISNVFCKKFDGWTKASFYFTSDDKNLAQLLKILADFVIKNDIQKLSLEKVDAELAAQEFAKTSDE